MTLKTRFLYWLLPKLLQAFPGSVASRITVEERYRESDCLGEGEFVVGPLLGKPPFIAINCCFHADLMEHPGIKIGVEK